ncbi:endonuclease I [Vibrio breoganii]|uniref:endonuclease n=1 Tax=Vibrio breoganii TaxID=553239 RepID=UPI000C824F19|nr:endonuclease [Vibrio breoganii]PMF80619.1 endonuclease I [Vibrio breoganii]
MKNLSIFTFSILITLPALSANQTNDSFSKAKRMLEKEVYQHHRETIYCGASFDSQKNIIPPKGFKTTKYVKRAKKVEWEHVVPAENFGRAFSEWRDGHEECVNNKGKAFKGRRCAEKVNMEYRYMQADMFNLYPAIGAVNALRQNYNFTMLPSVESDFGTCAMKIDYKKAEPPEEARGRISRTYMYMDQSYPKYSMSKQQTQLMEVWDKKHPVNQWECDRAKTIAELQGNENNVVKSRCTTLGLY